MGDAAEPIKSAGIFSFHDLFPPNIHVVLSDVYVMSFELLFVSALYYISYGLLFHWQAPIGIVSYMLHITGVVVQNNPLTLFVASPLCHMFLSSKTNSMVPNKTKTNT